MIRRRDSLALLLPLIAAPTTLRAQEVYPQRPITIAVGFTAGGVSDLLARFVAEFANRTRGVTVVVENRPGALSMLAAQHVARSPRDGHVVGVASISAVWAGPIAQTAPYDPRRDLSYLGQLFDQPLALYVRQDSPHRDWKGLLDYARANPRRLSVGTSGTRGVAEILAMSAFQRENVEVNLVAFRGGPDANSNLVGGHVDAVVSTDFGPLLAQNAIRLLVETGPHKIPGQPDVPTFKDLGYPFALPTFYGMIGPAGMAPAALAWWDSLLRDIAVSPDFLEFCRRNAGIPNYKEREAFTRFVVTGFEDFRALAAAVPER